MNLTLPSPNRRGKNEKAMKDKNEYISNSAEETQKIAEDLARSLRKGGIITLSGDLGYGKTTFTQGFAKGLGVTHRIISPTFVITRKYELRDKSAAKLFYHIDLYRIQNLEDLEGLGIKEILKDPEAVVLIEWPEKLRNLLPEKRIEIQFEYLGEDQRKIRIKDMR